MTHTDFLRFEQQLVTLCRQYEVFIKDVRFYADRPQDNLHYRDILLKAKVSEKLHLSPLREEDITETKLKI